MDLTTLDLKVLKIALKLNISSPAAISLHTQLPESRVSESLKRLGIGHGSDLDRRKLTEAALKWLERSRAFEEVSRSLSWELFEIMVARMLEETGLKVYRNITVTSDHKRAQLDILALKGDVVYLIECKRWMRSLSGSLALNEARKLKARMNLFCRALIGLLGSGDVTHYIIPILVSPYTSPAISEVFITPLRALNSLLAEHPLTLPSPPVNKLKLGRKLEPQLLKSSKVKVGH